MVVVAVDAAFLVNKYDLPLTLALCLEAVRCCPVDKGPIAVWPPLRLPFPSCGAELTRLSTRASVWTRTSESHLGEALSLSRASALSETISPLWRGAPGHGLAGGLRRPEGRRRGRGRGRRATDSGRARWRLKVVVHVFGSMMHSRFPRTVPLLPDRMIMSSRFLPLANQLLPLLVFLGMYGSHIRS